VVLMLLEMLAPKRPPAISTARDSAPISIHAASPAPRIPTAFIIPAVGTTAWPPGVGLPLYLATPFPFTFSRKALLARRRHCVSCCPTSAPEAISIVFDLETISARTRQRLWWRLMDRVWTWTCLYMQLVLRRGEWRAMNLLLWKNIWNRVVWMRICVL